MNEQQTSTHKHESVSATRIVVGVFGLLLLTALFFIAASMRQNTGQQSQAQTTNVQSSNSQLTSCEDVAHQQYDPQIRVAMGNGTSMQPMEELQQALATCQSEYGNSQ